MVPVTIDTLVIDDSDPAPFVHIIGVTSDDPTFMAGEDVEITGDLSLNVRAEKTQKNGRLYVIYVEARDASGNSSVGVTMVRIGHTTGHNAPF